MGFGETEPRFRINAKQTAKGTWQIDATVEYKSDKIKRSTNPEDPGDEIVETLGMRLLSLIKDAEDKFRRDGRMMAGDQ